MDDDLRLARPAALGGERRSGLELAHEVVRRGRGVGASRRDHAREARERLRALAGLLRADGDRGALGEVLERIEPYAYAQPGALDDSLEAAKDPNPCGGQLVARVRADDRPDERGRRHGYPPAMDDAAALELAKRAAFRGGRVALAKLGDPGYLTWKGQRDVVTGATLEVQQAIVSVLQNECPDDAILVEEGPEDEPLAVDAERLWIVDPICGTLNAKPWDVAAACVILPSAGGLITDADGGSWLHSDGSYVAANPASHQWALRGIKGVQEHERARN